MQRFLPLAISLPRMHLVLHCAGRHAKVARSWERVLLRELFWGKCLQFVCSFPLKCRRFSHWRLSRSQGSRFANNTRSWWRYFGDLLKQFTAIFWRIFPKCSKFCRSPLRRSRVSRFTVLLSILWGIFWAILREFHSKAENVYGRLFRGIPLRP